MREELTSIGAEVEVGSEIGLSLPAQLCLPLPEPSNLIKCQLLNKMQLFSRCCLLTQMEVCFGDGKNISRASNLGGCGGERNSRCCHYSLITTINYTPPSHQHHSHMSNVPMGSSLEAERRQAGRWAGSWTCWFSFRKTTRRKGSVKVANIQSLHGL